MEKLFPWVYGCVCVCVFVYMCMFVLYSLTFLRGCEARSQIIIITIVIKKTLSAANRTTGAYSDNVSSEWSETRQHTWRRGAHEHVRRRVRQSKQVEE